MNGEGIQQYFYYQSEIKNIKISKTSKEQTIVIIPHFIYVRVQHQHLGHLAKVTNCNQPSVFWLVLTPAALLTTKYRPCRCRFSANADHAFKALCQLFHLSWGLFSKFIWQYSETNKTFNPSTFNLVFSKFSSNWIFNWGLWTSKLQPNWLFKNCDSLSYKALHSKGSFCAITDRHIGFTTKNGHYGLGPAVKTHG